MSFLAFLALWFIGMVAFALWDAHFGFGVEFDGKAWPPIGIAYVFWPITLPCALIAVLGKSLESTRDRRIKRVEQRTRIRVAAEKEQEALLEQIEREMMEDESVSPTRSRRSTRN